MASAGGLNTSDQRPSQAHSGLSDNAHKQSLIAMSNHDRSTLERRRGECPSPTTADDTKRTETKFFDSLVIIFLMWQLYIAVFLHAVR